MKRSHGLGLALGLGLLLVGAAVLVLFSAESDLPELRVVESETVEPGDPRRVEFESGEEPRPVAEAPTGQDPVATEPVASEAGSEEPTGAEVYSGEDAARVTGHVTDAFGAPVPKADLYLLAMPSGGQILHGEDFGGESRYAKASVQADGLGRFSLSVAPGAYTLGAEAPGFGRAHVPLHLRAREEQRVDIVLREGGSLDGHVRSTEGQPIAGARVDAFGGWNVELGPGGATTDADGHFRISGLTPGAYFTVARATGYVPAFQGNLRENSSGVVFKLVAAPRLRGRVVDKGSGEGLTGFQLRIRYPRDQEAGWLRSNLTEPQIGVDDDPSAFEVLDLSPGHMSVTVTASGYAPQTFGPFMLGVGEEKVLKVELGAGGQAAGLVRTPDGDPIAGALVVRFQERAGLLSLLTVASEKDLREGLSAAEETRTGPDGRYVLERVETGEQTLVAFKQGHSVARVSLSVSEGEKARAPDLVLETRARVTGTVRRQDGGPVASMVVVAFGPGGVRTVPLDAEGAFSIDGLGAGTYRLSVNRGHQPLARTQVSLAAGEWKRLVLEVSTGARVEGRVTVPGEGTAARVQLLARASGVGSYAGDVEEGRYAIEGVAPGTYSVLVDGVRVLDAVDVPEAASFPLDLTLPGGAVLGRVVGAGDGAPVANARALVWLDQGETPLGEEGLVAGFVAAAEVTAEGTFELNGLEARSYRLVVLAEGFAPSERSLKLSAGERHDAGDLVLEAGVGVAGTVTDAGGAPLAGAQIYVTAPGTGALVTATPVAAISDSNGAFVIGSLPPAPVQVSAFLQGKAPATANLEPAAGATTSLRLGTPCSPTLVVTSGGAPAAGVAVVLTHDGGALLRVPLLSNAQRVSGVTDANGAFSTSELPAGAYTATLGGSVTVSFTLTGGAQTVPAALAE